MQKRLLLKLVPKSRGLNRINVRCMGGGDHHHGPNKPPFARLRPPSGSLPLEVENVWDDGVAPETAVDFDAPDVSTNPEASNPALAKTHSLKDPHFLLDYGMISQEEYDSLMEERGDGDIEVE